MEQKLYLAHVTEDGRQQTVLEHLEGTSELCEKFASAFDAPEQGRLAGLAHDLGKYSNAFQKRLLNNGSKVDHATAGGFECAARNQIFAAFAVMGHHSGLPDGGSRTDNAQKATYFGRVKRAQKGQLENYSAWTTELSLPDAKMPPITVTDPLDLAFFTRMLYSCLVDADFLDTERFMKNGQVERGGGDDMATLYQKLETYIAGWFPPNGELNAQRCAILNNCLEQGTVQKPGLFTLTVPTGGGKTVASLAFALRHAKEYGLRRIIYVVPYTSIIEQTADVFRNILGSDNVLEHHSGVDYEGKYRAANDSDDNEDIRKRRMSLATENWDIPIVVTTAVQFFESLYGSRASQCRKLHNIAGSVIIFDEAQLLPLSHLRPCVSAIAQLVKSYHVTAVLCTATQPALEPIFRDFLPEVKPLELCPVGTFRPEVFQRVRYRNVGLLEQSDLAARLNGEHQVLCVVNLRKTAYAIFQQLDQDGAFHLSTLMVPAHRRQVLDIIRQRLNAGLPCRVVSTSLIEAGVDVDFPTVYREEVGLDSILQSGGRCNREGTRDPDTSIVTVFRTEEKPPDLFATATGVSRLIMENYEDFSSQEAIHSYFRQLLYVRGEKAQDQSGILPMLKSQMNPMPFRTLSEHFHLISDATRTVYIPWGSKGAELVERLRKGERSRSLFRQLGQYGVALYDYQYRELWQTSLEDIEDGAAVLSDMNLYSAETGLTLTSGGGNALFD